MEGFNVVSVDGVVTQTEIPTENGRVPDWATPSLVMWDFER